MSTARRVEEEMVNEGLSPQGPQGDQVPQGNQVPVDAPAMTNEEMKLALLTLAKAMMDEVYRDVGLRVNAIESTMASRLRDFSRMNSPSPHEFLGSNVLQANMDKGANPDEGTGQ
ncbi:hypothetical protein MTR67_026116 [Solanum verrucosum]|uniref:Uncharacterized protein n=1 Tax=Solanum verrucosum TaxID=315347 RepID=A0AAF0QZX5_SOLVR|nr:hypothetical protein MTR67_026116 [Solanum verrucosum]